MSDNIENTPAEELTNILPEDPTKAINMLMRLTQNLCRMADRESQALAHNDMVSFAILQDEKVIASEHYMKGCEEFHAGIQSFKGIEPALLTRLEALQAELGEKNKANNKTVEQLYDRSRAKTQSALVAAQEIAQGHHITFEDRSEGAANENTAANGTGA